MDENIFEKVSHVKKTVTGPNDLSISGKYLGLILLRLHENCTLQHEDSKEQRDFILLEVGFVNLSDYVLPIGHGKFRMIDSQEFQHEQCNYDRKTGFNLAVSPSKGRPVPAHFAAPMHELEGHAKTKGWIWFDGLTESVHLARLIYRQDVYGPGQTSGWVQHTDTLEFIIPDCALVPSKLALPA
jgi:hypothetical protein